MGIEGHSASVTSMAQPIASLFLLCAANEGSAARHGLLGQVQAELSHASEL